MQSVYKHLITWGEKSPNPGESGRDTGLSPSGIENIGGGGEMVKFDGLLNSSGGLELGEDMAPARSWEKDLQSSESEKKLERSVIGPGLNPMVPGVPLEKNVSVKERGGSVMVVGREGNDLEGDGGCCCFGCWCSFPFPSIWFQFCFPRAFPVSRLLVLFWCLFLWLLLDLEIRGGESPRCWYDEEEKKKKSPKLGGRTSLCPCCFSITTS